MKFNMGCLDEINSNTWIPGRDVNENKRLEIGTALANSQVFFFFLSFFSFIWNCELVGSMTIKDLYFFFLTMVSFKIPCEQWFIQAGRYPS